MLMTKAAYARHKGVSRQTVYDWIKKGELVLVGAKIDVDATDQRATDADIPAAWRDDNKLVNISPRATLFSKDHDYSQEKYQTIQLKAGVVIISEASFR